MDVYTQAKANILKYQSADDVALLCADDAGSLGLRPYIQGQLRTFSMEQEVADGAFLRQDEIVLRNGSEKVICTVDEVRLRGRHNLLNVLAAVALADSVGIEVEAMRQAIRTFKGVEHRLEWVRTLNGVQYINDSIATAPERALAAVHAFAEPVILLAGGKDKDMAWDNWAEVVAQKVKEVVLFGDLAQMLADKLAGFAHVHRVETMAEAVQLAADTAVSGDIVLLSPGGTSFDAFNDFAERGELFRELVNELK
jgi:UDP-N-acetylmuramoylalanine--D-glutamate ligase